MQRKMEFFSSNERVKRGREKRKGEEIGKDERDPVLFEQY